jgi:hypothetical protein
MSLHHDKMNIMASVLMSLFLHHGMMPAQDADSILCIRPSWSRSFECRGDERTKTRGGARATSPLDNRASASCTARFYIVASTSLDSMRYRNQSTV